MYVQNVKADGDTRPSNTRTYVAAPLTSIAHSSTWCQQGISMFQHCAFGQRNTSGYYACAVGASVYLDIDAAWDSQRRSGLCRRVDALRSQNKNTCTHYYLLGHEKCIL